ncbi:hypothetical protein AMTR_s00050p00077080 [Amborella trichopoda]|uniref:Secreted protein n=1 Tax=Amborella trichopoda TaxID=13333 RepID=W1PXB9_AMBTC|nr:hypothetical protein AMTR_s00050p00077080 [Amborella trichopoda]
MPCVIPFLFVALIHLTLTNSSQKRSRSRHRPSRVTALIRNRTDLLFPAEGQRPIPVEEFYQPSLRWRKGPDT